MRATAACPPPDCAWASSEPPATPHTPCPLSTRERGRRSSRRESKSAAGLRAPAVAALSAALLASACVAVTGQSAADPALAARIAELEAKEEIRGLIVNYGRYLDARDFAAYASLFAEGGVWTGGFGTFEGRDAILRMLEDNLGPATPAGPRTPLATLHLVSNEIIEVDMASGGDRATAISKWFFITAGPDGAPRLLLAGRYEDELVREGGRWLIARRTAIGDIPEDE